MSQVVGDQPCPYCNQKLLVALNEHPGPGSVVICHACAEILVVGRSRFVRRLSLAELVGLTQTSAWATIVQIRRFIRQRSAEQLGPGPGRDSDGGSDQYRVFPRGIAKEVWD